MTIKITMKMGDDIHVMSEDEMKSFGGDEEGINSLMTAKSMIKMITTTIDMDPNYRGKRIEMITEFDDGTYIVFGRKQKEEEGFGT